MKLVAVVFLFFSCLFQPLLAQKTGKAVSKQPSQKVVNKNPLADFGYGERILAISRPSDGRPVKYQLCALQIVTKSKFDTRFSGNQFYDGLKVGQQVATLLVKNYFKEDGYSDGDFKPTAFIRLAGDVVELLPIDGGVEWSKGVRKEGFWLFAVDNASLRLLPLEQEFSATEYQAIQFDQARVINYPKVKNAMGNYLQGRYPISLGGALVLARSGYEVNGLFRLPFVGGVIKVHGLKIDGSYLLISGSAKGVIGQYQFTISPYQTQAAPGVYADYASTVLFTLNEKGLALVYGASISGEVNSGAITCFVRPGDLRSNSELAKEYREHFGDQIWCSTDESDSFIKVSDRLFVDAGLVVYMPPLYKDTWTANSPNNPDGWSDFGRNSIRIISPIKERAEGMSAKIRLMPLPNN